MVTGGRIAVEFFGGLVLMLFVMFFLIKDGERIWAWLIGALRDRHRGTREPGRARRLAGGGVLHARHRGGGRHPRGGDRGTIDAL